MKTQLTREYFERHGFEIKVEKAWNNYQLWKARYSSEYSENTKCFEHGSFGYVRLSVTNCMYPQRFAIEGEINGTNEGYFSGQIFFTTVEDLEEFVFNICHMTSDVWVPETINQDSLNNES